MQKKVLRLWRNDLSVSFAETGRIHNGRPKYDNPAYENCQYFCARSARIADLEFGLHRKYQVFELSYA